MTTRLAGECGPACTHCAADACAGLAIVPTLDMSQILCLYHIQNGQGEAESSPNAFFLPQTKLLTLRHIQRHFPLRDYGFYHFRFKVPTSKSYLWADMSGLDSTVPLCDGNVVAKLLRLGT